MEPQINTDGEKNVVAQAFQPVAPYQVFKKPRKGKGLNPLLPQRRKGRREILN